MPVKQGQNFVNVYHEYFVNEYHGGLQELRGANYPGKGSQKPLPSPLPRKSNKNNNHHHNKKTRRQKTLKNKDIDRGEEGERWRVQREGDFVNQTSQALHTQSVGYPVFPKCLWLFYTYMPVHGPFLNQESSPLPFRGSCRILSNQFHFCVFPIEM